MEAQREERVWKKAQIASLSIWEPVTEWSGDGKLGHVTVSDSETPGREPGGEVKDRLSLELGREIGAGDPPGKVKREWRTEP